MKYMKLLATNDFGGSNQKSQVENPLEKKVNYQNIQVVQVNTYASRFELEYKSKKPEVNKKLIIEKNKKIYETESERNILKRKWTKYRNLYKKYKKSIDEEGNVANFTEIEQFFFYQNYCCSHIQIRGTVPTFWGQTGISAKTKITRGYEYTNSAFLKHFDDLRNTYKYVLSVNLMKKHNENEQLVTESYEAHLKNNCLDFVRYRFFDFHTVCKDQRYEKVNPTIKELHEMSVNFGFFAEDIQTGETIQEQNGVVRTNCLDCLDRTNVFQNKIGLDMLDVQLQQLDIILKEEFNEEPLDHLDNNNIKTNHPFMVKFKCAWADCGDNISKHYTGTGSTHTDVTKKGKRDFEGMLQHGQKTISRFYLQNFEDTIKQETIDIVLGQQLNNIVNVFEEEDKVGIQQQQGCTAIKFNLDDTSLNFMNIHLDQGNSKYKLQNLSSLHSSIYKQNKSYSKYNDKLEYIDYNFLFGDTGYSNQLMNTQILQCIQNYEQNKLSNKEKAEKSLNILLENDEFNINKKNLQLLDQYYEQQIKFLPNYKYLDNSNDYDTNFTPA
ncbi:hypothetical protein IMG5_130860, partial [Ichthyophthirius multifiliis]